MSDEVLSSSWCTNWGAFNTPRLWAMVSDEDDPDAWRQVAAWGEVAGAVQEHRTRLVQARDALTAAWPPEQNGASQAFETELNTLIARMDTAQTDADTTATGLANILEALRTAKTEIQPLYEQYKDKNSDWVPGWWDHAEDEIDKKAQDQMIKAEQTVEQHVAQLKVPDPYTMDPKGGRIITDPPSKSADSTGTGSSSAHGTGSSSTLAVPVPHDPVPPMPGQDPIAPDGSGADVSSGSGDSGSGSANPGSTVGGPGLAGVITPPGTTSPVGTAPGPAAPPGGVLPGGVLPGGVSPVIGGDPIPGVYPGLGSGGALPAKGGTLDNVKAGGLRGDTAAGEVPPGLGGGYARGGRPVTTRGMPPGAVIGESIGGGARGAGRAGGAPERGRAGRSGAAKGGTPGASKPTPPSWLPEEEGGSARGGRAGSAGISGRGRRRGDGSSDNQPFDPDNPWAVAEGVDPVIIPTDDNDRHDPGPNVIGWRR